MLLTQLDKIDADFMIGQINHEAQSGSRTYIGDIGIFANNMNGPIQVNSQHVDTHTFEENIVNKERSEVDYVMTMVETRLQDTVLTAIENLKIPRN